MQVIVHRWQQNRGSYNNQRFEMAMPTDGGFEAVADGALTFWGANFDGRMKSVEPGMKNFRTQKVDRIEVDTYKGEVHIYTSALVERAPRRARKVDTDAALEPLKPLTPSPDANSAPIECDLPHEKPTCYVCHGTDKYCIMCDGKSKRDADD